MRAQLSANQNRLWFDTCAIRFSKNNGGGDRVRTRDPQLAKLVLYQLSYAPNPGKRKTGKAFVNARMDDPRRTKMVHPSGFEPLTSRLSGACSNQLSYGCGHADIPTERIRREKDRESLTDDHWSTVLVQPKLHSQGVTSLERR